MTIFIFPNTLIRAKKQDSEKQMQCFFPPIYLIFIFIVLSENLFLYLWLTSEIPLREAITTEERQTPLSLHTLAPPQEQPCIFHSRFSMSSYRSNLSSLTSSFYFLMSQTWSLWSKWKGLVILTLKEKVKSNLWSNEMCHSGILSNRISECSSLNIW